MTMLGKTSHSTARKPHRCAHCDHTIEPGEAQAAWAWKDGASVLSVHVHAECYSPCVEFCQDNDNMCAQGDEVLRGVPLQLLDEVPCLHCGDDKAAHFWREYESGKPQPNACTRSKYEPIAWPERKVWLAAQKERTS